MLLRQKLSRHFKAVENRRFQPSYDELLVVPMQHIRGIHFDLNIFPSLTLELSSETPDSGDQVKIFVGNSLVLDTIKFTLQKEKVSSGQIR